MAISDANTGHIIEKLSELAFLILDAPAAPDGQPPVHAARINTTLTRLDDASNARGLRGLSYLFRILHKLPVRWPVGGAESDHVLLSQWIGELCSFLLDGADDEHAAGLVTSLANWPWMPPLQPRLIELVGTALIADAVMLRQATAGTADECTTEPGTPAATPPTFAQANADNGTMVETAFTTKAFAAPALAAAGSPGECSAFAATDLRYEHDAFAAQGLPVKHATFAAIDLPDEHAAFATDGLSDEQSAFATNESFGEHSLFAETTLSGEPAFPADSTAPWPLTATADGTNGEAPQNHTTWVSTEELALISDAIAAQLLPPTSALLEAEHLPRAQQQEALQACAEQFELVHAALGALGLLALQQLGDAYSALLRRLQQSDRFADDALQALGLWPVLLIGHLQAPRDPPAAQDLVNVLAEQGLLSPHESAALAIAITQVNIGVDPAVRSQRKRLAESEDVALDVAQDVLPSVLAGMLQELPGRAAEFSRNIQRYCSSGSAADLDTAQRIAHTLKGDGNIVGVRGIANLTHALEEILLLLSLRPERRSNPIENVLVDAADMLEAMSDRVLGRAADPEGAVELLQRVLDCANALQDDNDDDQIPVAVHATECDDSAAEDIAESTTAAVTPATAAPEPEAGQTITLPMRLLDELLRLTGEAVIYARQVENRVERVERRHGDISVQGKSFETLIVELQQLVEVRGAALTSQRMDQGEEFDDLEMDRYNELHTVTLRLVEASADARASASELNQDVVALRDLLAQQDRVHLDLRDRVQRARTVPLHGLLPRLQRVVRQTARQLGKLCELHIDGEDTVLDQELLEGLAEPLLHLLRNAVDHGIEAPGQRSAAGKPAQGGIRLAFRREADRVIIRCRDDGSGLDLDAIRHKALERGLIDPARRYGDAELTDLIFHTGFSTRSQATLTSGRGIGMDIVRRRVAALKGSVSVRSEHGQGCEFELRLPLSQVAAQVLLAESARTRLAINLSGVQRMALYEASHLLFQGSQLQLQLPDETPRRAVYLDHLLGFANEGASPRGRQALLVATEDNEAVAVLMESVSEARSVIVKGLGPHVMPNPGVLGATILGDGSVAPVIDLPQLVSRLGRSELPQLAGSRPHGAVHDVPAVLIVDDSLSVRRSLEQVIGDAGFRVSTARDGLEAVEQVRGQRPDLMVIDLEMPRMNGLELASFIRKEAHTRAIPIIMITSRTTERHREMARAAGVDTILSKPYSEEGLLALIADKLARGRAAA